MVEAQSAEQAQAGTEACHHITCNVWITLSMKDAMLTHQVAKLSNNRSYMKYN